MLIRNLKFIGYAMSLINESNQYKNEYADKLNKNIFY